MPKKPSFVQLHRSNIPMTEIGCAKSCIQLPTNRKVMVGRMTPPLNGVVIRFETPEPDSDRIVVLEFGLNQDAAKALFDLLKHEL